MSLSDQHVMIDYTNHAGVRAVREIIPLLNGFRFGSTDWHHEPQWLLDAHDVAKDDMRTFAVKDIHDWAPKASAVGRAIPSLAKQLQSSMEQNARMINRVKKLRERLAAAWIPTNVPDTAAEMAALCGILESVLKDEEPTW